jgi:hypothetical protein
MKLVYLTVRNWLEKVFKITLYYLILYPAIYLMRLQNWICKIHPEHPDEWPWIWYKTFWIAMKMTDPARKLEWELDYNGWIHIEVTKH